MEHAFAQTHSAESFPKGLASRRNSGDSVACARDDRVGRSEGFAICHPERSAQREVEDPVRRQQKKAPHPPSRSSTSASDSAMPSPWTTRTSTSTKRVRHHHRQLGLRQDHAVENGERAGDARRWTRAGAREGHERRRPHRAAPKHRLRHPRQRAVSPPHRGAEHRVRASLLNSGDEGRTEEPSRNGWTSSGCRTTSWIAIPPSCRADRRSASHRPRVAASPDIRAGRRAVQRRGRITRGSCRTRSSAIHRQTGITVLFVTHDIDEALDLGDKVLVMEPAAPCSSPSRATSCATPPPSSSTAWLRASASCTRDSAPPQIAALSEKAVPSRGSRPSHHYPEPSLHAGRPSIAKYHRIRKSQGRRRQPS